ncbi:MAG: DUF4062 domain-containing protein [Planctomycetota bacterium]
MKAFVSSTYEDLREHRAHVISALRRAGIAVDPMEDWTATGSEPREFCADRLRGCEICVLLVARRRGFVPPREAKSITQIEYEAARERKLEVLVFLLDDGALWRREWDELDRDPELRRWRERLTTTHGVEFFSHDPRSIDVAPAVARWVARGAPPQRVVREQFRVEWSVFLPFCPGVPPPDGEIPGLRLSAADAESTSFESAADANLTMRWFGFGGAVWTLRQERRFGTLAEFAQSRRQLYRAILHHPARAADHAIPALTAAVNEAAAARCAAALCQRQIGYALSLVSLLDPGWQTLQIPHALQVLACPSLLLNLPEAEDCALDDHAADPLVLDHREAALVADGNRGHDLKEFRLPGVMHAVACWAGVAAHVQSTHRDAMVAAFVRFEELIQALWWRLHSLESLLDVGQIPQEAKAQLTSIERHVHKALRIGPTEVTATRLFKEAVIQTSRIESVFNEFRNTVRDLRSP